MSEASHLKHWRSELVELKDKFLRGEIGVDRYHALAYPLQKKIREAEAS